MYVTNNKEPWTLNQLLSWYPQKLKDFNQMLIQPTCEIVRQMNGYNINTTNLLHTLVF